MQENIHVASRNGNIIALEFDALIVPHLKQKLIGGRAVTNGMDFQVILDKDPNVCGIYPRVDGKLCSIEDSIPFISDDSLLFHLEIFTQFICEADRDGSMASAAGPYIE